MKARTTRRERRTSSPRPLGKLDLRVEVSQEEILADLAYPVAPRRNRAAR